MAGSPFFLWGVETDDHHTTPRFALESIRTTVAAFAARQITEEEMPALEKYATEHCPINAQTEKLKS